uniref:Uncharacterized protein n=1 Tax=Oryza brachyantha TaxID=4533 RepID=J3LAN4_ORYBR
MSNYAQGDDITILNMSDIKYSFARYLTPRGIACGNGFVLPRRLSYVAFQLQSRLEIWKTISSAQIQGEALKYTADLTVPRLLQITSQDMFGSLNPDQGSGTFLNKFN